MYASEKKMRISFKVIINEYNSLANFISVKWASTLNKTEHLFVQKKKNKIKNLNSNNFSCNLIIFFPWKNEVKLQMNSNYIRSKAFPLRRGLFLYWTQMFWSKDWTSEQKKECLDLRINYFGYHSACKTYRFCN